MQNLVAARREVRAALVEGLAPAADVDDAELPSEIPSVRARGAADRVLAEIDVDGFAFAAAPEDIPRFNRRATKHPRQGHLIDIVLEGGRVCVRKRFRGPAWGAVHHGSVKISPRDWALRNAWHLAGVHFYSEAAALLRLRELPFVPKLRRVDLARRTLWIDCLAAESLRHVAASSGEPVHDADLPASMARGDAEELDRREARLLDGVAGGGWRDEVGRMAREVNARGVVPLDIKLGNFLRGKRTGRLYWIDFERSRLDSQPGFVAALAEEQRILRELFNIDYSSSKR